MHKCDDALALECQRDICTDISVYILLRHSTNPVKCLMEGETTALVYIAITNSILTMSFNFEPD